MSLRLMVDMSTDVNGSVELNEANGEKTYVISGQFSTPDKKNRNGRVYSRAIWESNVSRYQDEIKNNTNNTLMELEHPPRTSVDPWEAVAKIRKLEMRNGNVYGEAVILNNGDKKTNQIKALIEAGVKIGVSTRGTGKMKGDIVEEYNLITVDIVSNPSDYNANLEGFNESMILEGVEIESNGKGGWVCTPAGCTMTPVNEGTVESRLKIDGYSVDIEYHPPKGYVAIGKSKEIKNAIARKYFNTEEEAKEHAELEIDGYMNESKTPDWSIVTQSWENEDCQCEECKRKRGKMEESLKVGDKVTTSVDKKELIYGRKGTVKRISGDFIVVDFGNGDSYGISKSRFNGNVITGTETTTEKPCGCKAKELTEALETIARGNKLTEAELIDAELKAKFVELFGRPMSEMKSAGGMMDMYIVTDGKEMFDFETGEVAKLNVDIFKTKPQTYTNMIKDEKSARKEASENGMKVKKISVNTGKMPRGFKPSMMSEDMSRYFAEDLKTYQKVISDLGGYIKDYDEKLYKEFDEYRKPLNKLLNGVK